MMASFIQETADSLKTRLSCHRWRDGCKSTTFIQGNPFHSKIICQHDSEMSEVKKIKVESENKIISGTTCTPLKQIYDSHVTIESNIQRFVKLQWAMSKLRKKNLPPTPTSEGFENSLKKAVTIAPCFREIAKVAENFFLLFFGDLTGQRMENVSTIHADCTFKIAPKKFYHLVIIHCVFSDVLYPVFFEFMTTKSRLLDNALFLSIRNFFPSFEPTNCVVNFETALYSSIILNFESQMQGCLFHCRQALWRKWSRLGFVKD